VLFERVNERVAEESRGSPEPTRFVELAVGQRRSHLSEHFGGRTVARVGIAGDFSGDRTAVVEDSHKAQIEETVRLGSRGRSLTGCGQDEAL
jgi:hypothetical protein